MIRKLIVTIMVLILSFTVALVMASEPFDRVQIQTNPAPQTIYPPYPDVWDWVVPKADKPIDAGLNVKAMDNGDVMITYRQDRKNGKVRYVTYFGKTAVGDPKAVYKDDYTNDAKSRITFKDEYFLRKIGGGTRSGGCYDALDFDIAVYDNTELKVLSSKKMLHVFDEPKRYVTYPHCMNGPSFYYQVKAVDAKFIPLKDRTFLLVTPEGYIIRFDENFQTKSNLMNNKFFWMEEAAWLEFNAHAKYGDRAVGDKDLKRLYNDLYSLLMSKKRR